jgi:hypothetical protein
VIPCSRADRRAIQQFLPCLIVGGLVTYVIADVAWDCGPGGERSSNKSGEGMKVFWFIDFPDEMESMNR